MIDRHSMKSRSGNSSDLHTTGQCNFYDIEKNVSCYKKAMIRKDADDRILCSEHYKKYKEILKTENRYGY